VASAFAGPVQDLIDELNRLPGIGPKSAQRIAYHLLKVDKPDALRLARTIVEVKERIGFCQICFNIADGPECNFCRDPRRDDTVICVVEEAPDVVAIERTGAFRGRYHVLQGAISPIDGVGPKQLRIEELLRRISDHQVAELIICTNPTIEGETTATYLARLLSPLGMRITRLARGLPGGGDLEYADELTLGRAIEGRHVLDIS
jgi:recombination protein RecR